MIKKLIFTAYLIIILTGNSFSQSNPKKSIRDGLYLIIKIDTSAAEIDTLTSKQIAINISPMFSEYNKDEYLRIIIDTTQFVPLELEKQPVTEQQTDLKKKLLLSLTKEASEQLKTFTVRYLMRRVALIVDGEALTIHKIKVVITSGQLQITRCNDNACERLFVKLKDNVKK